MQRSEAILVFWEKTHKLQFQMTTDIESMEAEACYRAARFRTVMPIWLKPESWTSLFLVMNQFSQGGRKIASFITWCLAIMKERWRWEEITIMKTQQTDDLCILETKQYMLPSGGQE